MFWVLKISITSIIIIFIFHKLYDFLKENLTIPKKKDLIKRPQQKYEELFRDIHSQKNINSAPSGIDVGSDESINKTMTDESINQTMKDDLKKYLMELKQ
jgi:hypothetical protein